MNSSYNSYTSRLPYYERNFAEPKYELLPELEAILNNEYDLQYDVEESQISAGTRTSKEYIRWLQLNLNRILKLKPALAVTGILDNKTKAALKVFQKKAGVTPTTDIPDEITERVLVKAGASTPPIHMPVAPSNCMNEKDITKEFHDFIRNAQVIIKQITHPPLTQRIINEILDIVGPEGSVNIPKFRIISCSKIINPLVFGDKILAEVLADQQIIHLAEETRQLMDEFMQTKDLSVLTQFFQTLAHEKRHATLGNTVEVKSAALKPGLGQDAADEARYMIHEILVKAEEIAVGKTLNPAYRVPVVLQQLFRRNFNIAGSLVADAELKRLRGVIVKELRKRYVEGKGCDSSLTLGVLKSIDTGQWFRCSNGSVIGKIPDGLNLCKNKDKTQQVCGVH